jgi:cbb3-type cytochrome oxidase subunit 3
MNAPKIKNEISVGTISSWVGLALLLVSAGGGWAAINARVDAREAADAAQNLIIKELTDDRNAMAQVLAEIRVDVGYLRRAEEEARRQARAGQ